MILLIVIITFILTLVIIELIPFLMILNYTNCPTESLENIPFNLENISFNLENYNKERNYIENLKDMTGLVFTKNNYYETTEVILDANYFIFFEDYDIFLNNNIKLKPNVIYQTCATDKLYIINYDNSDIHIYVN